MVKDIITIKDLTAVDGSVVQVGAHIGLDIEFPIHLNGYAARASIFRNKQIFESGYEAVRIKDLEDEQIKENVEDINLSTIYDNMVIFINEQFEEPVCEIVN